VRTLIAIARALIVAAPALAQSGGGTEEAEPRPLAQRVADWQRQLDVVEAELDEGPPPRERIEPLTDRVTRIRAAAQAARPVAQQAVEDAERLIEAVTPPEEQQEQTGGGHPMGGHISAERQRVEEELAQARARLQKVDLVVARAETLLDRISSLRFALITEEMFSRGPPLLTAQTWAEAGEGALTRLGRMVEAPGEWWVSGVIAQRRADGAFQVLAIAVALALAAAAWQWGRLRRHGRVPVEETRDSGHRALAAAVETLRDAGLPILLVWIVYAVMDSQELLVGYFAREVLGVAVGLSAFLAIRALSRAALSPFAPEWRIMPLGDEAAHGIHWRVVAIGLLFAIDLALALPVPEDAVSAQTRAVYQFLFGAAYAALFVSLLRRAHWRFAPVEPESAEEERPNRLWPIVRVMAALVAVAIPVAALLAFHSLSRFLAFNLVVASGVIATALILHGFAVEAIAVVTDPDTRSGRLIQRWFGLTRRFSDLCSSVVLFVVDLVLGGLVLVVLLPLWGVRWSEVTVWVEQALTGVTVGGVAFSLADIALALVVFVVLIVAVRALQRALDDRVLRRSGMQVGLRDAVRAGLGYTGVIVAGLIAVGVAGIDLSSLAIIAGALSVGIGFGLQNIVNNFVSGLILLVERPIQVGDWVIVGEHEGIVKRISVRATEITTFQRASVIIPNSTFLESSVLNWTHKDLTGRVEVYVSVAYGTDPRKVEETLLETARSHSKVASVPEPRAIFLAFGDSGLEFVLWAYTHDVNEKFDIGSDLRFAVEATFREAGIEIPYPQRDVHIVSQPGAESDPRTRRAHGATSKGPQSEGDGDSAE